MSDLDHLTEAIAQLQQARTLSDYSTLMTARLAAALAAAGINDEAKVLLIALQAIRDTSHVP